MEAPETQDKISEDIFTQMSHSSRAALTLADRVREDLELDEIHMEHLIYGLYAPQGGHTNNKFKDAGIESLDALLMELDLPEAAARLSIGPGDLLSSPPPMAADVRQALWNAKQIQEKHQNEVIRSIDLLAGTMQVQDSPTVANLIKSYNFLESLHRTDRESRPPEPELLTLTGTTRIRVAVTQQPWRLPVDAFTIPTDQDLEIGGLGSAFAGDMVGGSFDLKGMVRQRHGQVDTIDYQKPLLVPLTSDLAESLTARQFYVATAFLSDGRINPDSAAEAMSSLIRNAIEAGIQKMTSPLLGTGTGRLNFQDTARRLESLLPRSGGWEPGAEGPFEELIISVVNPTEKQVLVDLARGRRWNEMAPALRETLVAAQVHETDPNEAVKVPNLVRAVFFGSADPLAKRLRELLITQPMEGRSVDEALAKSIETWQEQGEFAATESDSIPALEEPVVEVIEVAANHLPPSRTTIEYRDLAAALFLALEPERTPPGSDFLAQAGYALPELGDRIIEFIESAHAAEAEHWRYTVRRGELRLPRLVSYDNDEIRKKITPEDDKLNVLPDAERFAGLLAADKVKPPIAVGLFGDWGTGKTFFMRLLQNRITALVDDNPNADYVARVVQIEFNAWHYADSNLWACLAMRIFDELAKAFGRDDESEVSRIRRKIHEEIESNKRRKSQVEQQKTATEDAREKKAKSLAEKKEERTRKKEKLTWDRLKRVVKDTLASDNFKSDKAAIQNAADRLGLSTVLEGYEDLQRLRGELDAVWNSARMSTSLIFNRFSNVKKAAVSLIVILLAIFIVDWIGIAYERLVLSVPETGAFFSKLSVTLVQIGALATAAAGWLGRNLKVVSQALGKLGVLREQIANEQATAEPDEEEKGLQDEIDALDEEIQQLSDEVAAADRSLERAEEELERINSGGLVYDFLMARRQNSLYLNELGLISTIRADFESLKRLLVDLEEHAKDGAVRIILYIDDLDRCQPDRVVEVLQAVHLLLAMDMFSVVVGVDARWLERSLYQEYVGKETRTSHPDPNRPAEVFSPQNYLEKIFQIPFTLPGMTETSFADLVDQLVTTRSEAEEGSEQATPDPGREEEAERKKKPSGEDPSEATTDTEEQTPTDESKTPDPDAKKAETTDQTGEKQAGDEGATPSPGEKDDDKSRQDSMREQIEALDLEKWEEAFISRLFGFVRTPRLVKRLVNVYRLIRMKASTEGDFIEFVGDIKGGEYRSVLVLLALNMGTPDLGRRILHMLSSAPVESSWENFIEQTKLVPTQPERQDWYGNWFRENPWPDTVQTEMADVADKIDKLRVDVGLPDSMDYYTKWARDVGRYSFHWHQNRAT